MRITAPTDGHAESRPKYRVWPDKVVACAATGSSVLTRVTVRCSTWTMSSGDRESTVAPPHVRGTVQARPNTAGDAPQTGNVVLPQWVIVGPDGAPTTAMRVVVGHRVTVRVAARVGQTTPTAIRWGLPGACIKAYDIHPVQPGQHGTSVQVTMHSDDDLSQIELSFFPTTGGTMTLRVTAAASSDGRASTAEATLEVLAPSARMSSQTGSVGVGNVHNQVQMYFGNHPTEEGIIWEATVTAPEGVSGTLFFVQLTKTMLSLTPLGGAPVRRQGTRDAWTLDDVCPYTSRVGGRRVITLAAGQTVTLGEEDSPAIPCVQFSGRPPTLAGVQVTSDEEFKTYLMFQPDAPSPRDRVVVALCMLSWDWRVTMSRSDADAAAGVNLRAYGTPAGVQSGWVLSRHTATPNPVGTPADRLPTWSQSAQYYDTGDLLWY